jgi:hypothetical protein
MQIKSKRAGSRLAFRFAVIGRDDELQHSLEGRNPEYSVSINLDAHPHLHGGRLCAGMTGKTPDLSTILFIHSFIDNAFFHII